LEVPSGWRVSLLSFVKKLDFSLQSIMAHVKERGVFFTKGRQLSAHELRVTAEEMLHGRLLGFEAEAGLALADGTDAEVGDILGH
jgi:hypothetical protein